MAVICDYSLLVHLFLKLSEGCVQPYLFVCPIKNLEKELGRSDIYNLSRNYWSRRIFSDCKFFSPKALIFLNALFFGHKFSTTVVFIFFLCECHRKVPTDLC